MSYASARDSVNLTRRVALPRVPVPSEVYRPVDLKHFQILLVQGDVSPEDRWSGRVRGKRMRQKERKKQTYVTTHIVSKDTNALFVAFPHALRNVSVVSPQPLI